MPLVRIEMPRWKSPEFRRTVGEVVYDTMIQAMKVPVNDRFQVISEHEPNDLIIDRTYLGVERSQDCIVIQVFLNEGRTTEVKKAFYRGVADGLHERLGLRLQDVFINLVEVKKENWSFGNGEAQYA